MELRANTLRRRADQCRDLAQTAVTASGREVLDGVATEYERKAIAAELHKSADAVEVSTFKWPLR